MLASVFIIIWTTIAGFAVGLFPDYHLPAAFFTSFHTIMLNLAVWSDVFPIVELLAAFGIIILFEITVVTVRFFIGLVALIRGSGKPEL